MYSDRESVRRHSSVLSLWTSDQLRTRITNDAILSSQFFAPRALSPCQALWFAVLADALHCCLGRVTTLSSESHHQRDAKTRDSWLSRKAQTAKSLALSWIQEQDERIGSFLFVCAILEIDAAALRAVVARAQRDPQNDEAAQVTPR